MGGSWRLATQVSFLILFAIAQPIAALTHYVSHSGNNTYPFSSWTTATSSISSAASACNAGDTIRLDTGSYLNTPPVQLDSGVTMLGEGIALTQVSCDGYPDGQFRTDIGNVRVTGISFRATDVTANSFVFSFHGVNDSLWVDGCEFVECNLAISSNAQYFSLKNCSFIDCQEFGFGIVNVGIGSGNGIIMNNTFLNHRVEYTSAISLYMFFFGLGEGNFVVSKNVFQGYQEGVNLSWSLGDVIIENNLFLNNLLPHQEFGTTNAPYIRVGTASFVIRNNFFEGNYAEPTLPEENVCMDVKAFVNGQIYNNAFAGVEPAIRIWENTELGTPYAISVQNNASWIDAERPQVIFRRGPFGHYTFDSVYCEDHFEYTDTSTIIISDMVCRDPMFVDTVGYQLQAGSPLIDAGRPDIIDLDFTRSDIGPWGGIGGGFYSYQDFAPRVPEGWNGQSHSGVATLRWLKNSESDLWYYALFKSTGGDIPLDSLHVLAYLTQTGNSLLRTAPNDSTMLEFNDSSFVAGIMTRYTMVAVDSSGLVSEAAPAVVFNGTAVDNDAEISLPETFALQQNYPNPFNSSTAIVYHLPDVGAQPAQVSLAIYNSLGQRIKVLVDSPQGPGQHRAVWDGRNEAGEEVASGVYFYRVNVFGIGTIGTRKMVLLK